MATYYVDPATGSNGNAGGASDEWATLGFALSQIAGGDEIVLRDGTYTETYVSGWPSGSSGAYTTVRAENRHGAYFLHTGSDAKTLQPDGNYLRIEGLRITCRVGHGIENPVQAIHHIQIVDNLFEDCGKSGASILRGDWMLFEGNLCRRCASEGWFHGLSSYNAVSNGEPDPTPAYTRNIWRNNVCEDIYQLPYLAFSNGSIEIEVGDAVSFGGITGTVGRVVLSSGTWAGGNAAGEIGLKDISSGSYPTSGVAIQVGGQTRAQTNATNYATNDGPYFSDGNGIILDDWNGGQTGIGAYTGGGALIENNITMRCGGKGIQVFDAPEGLDIVVRNNLSYQDNRCNWQGYHGSPGEQPTTWRGGISCHTAVVTMANNIAVAGPGVHATGLGVYGFQSGNAVLANNLYDTLNVNLASYTDAGGNQPATDPGFVSPTTSWDTADFTLDTGSPAIDAGTDAYGLPATDLAGNTRVVGGTVDIGPYEVQGASQQAPTLSNLVDQMDQDPPTLGYTSDQAGTVTWDFHTSATPPTPGEGDIATGADTVVAGIHAIEIDLSAHPGTAGYIHLSLSNANGTSNTLTTAHTTASVPLANLTLPEISGTADVGQVLSLSDGTWESTEARSYGYQWRRGGVDIAGATASTYTLVSADAGTSITGRVTATTASETLAATSAAVNIPSEASPTMADLIYRIDGGSWTLAEGVALPYTIPGVAAANDVEIFGHPAMLALAGETPYLGLDTTPDYWIDAATGSDLNDGTTEGAAWASLSKIDGSFLTAGQTTIVRVKAGTYDTADDYIETTCTASGATLEVAFEPGCTMDGANRADVALNGIELTGTVPWTTLVYGNGLTITGYKDVSEVNSPNGVGNRGENHLTMHDVYITDCNDGFSSHSDATMITHNCSASACIKGAFLHVNNATVAHYNCAFDIVGQSNGSFQDTVTMHLEECVVTTSDPAGSFKMFGAGAGSSMDTAVNCQFGTETAYVTIDGSGSATTPSRATITKSYLNAYIDGNDPHILDQCYGRVSIRARDPGTIDMQNSVIIGPAIGHSANKVAVIFSNFTPTGDIATIFSGNVVATASFMSVTSAVASLMLNGPCVFDGNSLWSGATYDADLDPSLISNTITTDPQLGAATGYDMADYVSAAGLAGFGAGAVVTRAASIPRTLP